MLEPLDYAVKRSAADGDHLPCLRWAPGPRLPRRPACASVLYSARPELTPVTNSALNGIAYLALRPHRTRQRIQKQRIDLDRVQSISATLALRGMSHR
jgi:hypothetical protein